VQRSQRCTLQKKEREKKMRAFLGAFFPKKAQNQFTPNVYFSPALTLARLARIRAVFRPLEKRFNHYKNISDN